MILPIIPGTAVIKKKRSPLPVQIWNFFVQRFFGFGVAVSEENADLARRRRIFGVFFRQQKAPSKTENAVLYIKYVIKVH